MLDQIRQNSQSTIIYILFGMLIFVFAVSFGPGSGGCGSVGPQNYAARVNGEDITAIEYSQTLERMVGNFRRSASASGIPFDSAMVERMGLRKQAIDSLIEVKLVGQYARAKGLVVPNDRLFSEIKDLFGTQDIDAEQYENIIRSNFQVSPNRFETNVRDQMLNRNLRDLVKALVVVSDEEARMQYGRDKDRVRPWLIRIDPKKSDAPRPDEAAIAKALAERSDDIKAYYDKNSFRYLSKLHREGAHILKKLDKDAPEAEVARVRGELLKLKEQIEGGADFSAIAKAASDDAETKDSGGALAAIDADVHPLAKQPGIVSLKIGDISEPIRTEQGMHLVKITKIDVPKARDFDTVKNEVALHVLENEAREDMAQQEAQRILAALLKGESLETLTREPESEGTKPIRQIGSWVRRADKALMSLPLAEDLKDELFELEKVGSFLPEPHKSNDVFFLVGVESREKPDWTKFDEEKDDLKDSIMQTRSEQMVRDWIQALRDQAEVTLNPSLFASASASAS